MTDVKERVLFVAGVILGVIIALMVFRMEAGRIATLAPLVVFGAMVLVKESRRLGAGLFLGYLLVPFLGVSSVIAYCWSMNRVGCE